MEQHDSEAMPNPTSIVLEVLSVTDSRAHFQTKITAIVETLSSEDPPFASNHTAFEVEQSVFALSC